MRAGFRYIVTGIGTALFVVFALGVETVATEWGYVSFIQGGWRAVVDAGYADWVRWGALFFSGGAVALWIDSWLRGRIEGPKHLQHASLRVQWQGHAMVTFDEMGVVSSGGAVMGESEAMVYACLEKPMLNPHVVVHCEMRGVKWMMGALGDNGAEVYLKRLKPDKTLAVEFLPTPFDRFDLRRQQIGVWYDAEYAPELPENTRALYEAGQWDRLRMRFLHSWHRWH